MGRRFVIALTMALVAAVLSVHIAAATPSTADPVPIDFPTEGGHFYTQASGLPDNPEGRGYLISDDDGIPFWTAFRQFGGVDELGYPISQRYVEQGLVHQATQRAILQWHPNEGKVYLVNLLDVLSVRGKDSWLSNTHLVPGPARFDERGLSYQEVQAQRLALLDANPVIHDHYFSVPDPIARFGLPVAPIADVGPAIVLRTQRSVLYLWKDRQPWAERGQVTVAMAGDIYKQAGLIPKEATIPQAPPEEARSRALTARGDRREATTTHVGVATWYGADFHGSRMSNGERYNMHDPTTAAANIFPLGTRLRVTRLATGESIIVRVTDRGAFRYPILVDLSYAAFASLANPRDGVIRISVEPVE